MVNAGWVLIRSQLQELTWKDEHSQPEEIEEEHRGQQSVGALGRAFEFLPDEHSPERADHGSALAQSVGERGAGLSAGDDAEGHADVPDHPAQDADQMQPGVALGEIVTERHRSAVKGLIIMMLFQRKLDSNSPALNSTMAV